MRHPVIPARLYVPNVCEEFFPFSLSFCITLVVISFENPLYLSKFRANNVMVTNGRTLKR